MAHVSTGSELIDAFLGGGYETDILTTIYGPAGSGKTNLALIAVKSQLQKDHYVVYIDTEGSFSSERMKQLMPDFKEHADKLLFLHPTTFDEQKQSFEQLKQALEDHQVGMIVIDSIAMLYRLEIGKSNDIYNVNKELGIQLGTLTEIARKKKIPVLITNQVYADFENKDAVKIVGGDLLKYSSKCLIELKKGAHSIRVAQLKKHRSLKEGSEVAFEIVNDGINTVDV